MYKRKKYDYYKKMQVLLNKLGCKNCYTYQESWLNNLKIVGTRYNTAHGNMTIKCVYLQK